MSENVSECLLVLEITHLKGKSEEEVLPFFQAVLETKDDLEDIMYSDNDLKVVSNGDKWGIAYVINKRSEDYGDNSAIVSLGDLIKAAEDKFSPFLKGTPLLDNLILADLHWYNGTDAPNVFDDIQKV